MPMRNRTGTNETLVLREQGFPTALPGDEDGASVEVVGLVVEFEKAVLANTEDGWQAAGAEHEPPCHFGRGLHPVASARSPTTYLSKLTHLAYLVPCRVP